MGLNSPSHREDPPGLIEPLISAWFSLYVVLLVSRAFFYSGALHFRPSGRVLFYRGSLHLSPFLSQKEREKNPRMLLVLVGEFESRRGEIVKFFLQTKKQNKKGSTAESA